MPNSRRFWTLVIVAAFAGLATELIINTFMDTPEVVDWCIAGSVGYVAAELAELVIDRTKRVKNARTPQ